MLTKEYVAPYREKILQKIRNDHILTNSGHDGRLFFITAIYPGYWLEHLYDSIVWAKLFPEDRDIAISQMRLFLGNQREDGAIPTYVLDNDFMNTIPATAKAYTGSEVCPPGLTLRYRQLQECVSVASLCLEVWEFDKTQDLSWYYERCAKWDEYICNNRMSRGKGLVEIYCGYDTGHDNSGRFFGMKYSKGINDFSAPPADCDVAPMISPDVNAVFYGNRKALAKMAEILGLEDEAREWHNKAEQVKKRLFEVCFDEEDCFFYDVDKHDNKIKVKSVSITTLYCEGLLDQDIADRIYERYLANPNEFGTPYPFPGVSVSDPTWQYKLKGNDWGYYSQGNVAIRSLRWMKKYGRENEMRKMMEAWLEAWCKNDIREFGQELHPITGEPSSAARWYSSTMLYLLTAIRELGLE